MKGAILMTTMKNIRCCGNCRHFEALGSGDFKERLKFRFRQPYCRLNNKPQQEESGRGCFVWQEKQ
jgi:hypothetical protein